MTRSFMVVEIRGEGIEYAYRTGLVSSTAHEICDGMNWRATTNREEFLQNGDGNPFTYVVRED